MLSIDEYLAQRRQALNANNDQTTPNHDTNETSSVTSNNSSNRFSKHNSKHRVSNNNNKNQYRNANNAETTSNRRSRLTIRDADDTSSITSDNSVSRNLKYNSDNYVLNTHKSNEIASLDTKAFNDYVKNETEYLRNLFNAQRNELIRRKGEVYAMNRNLRCETKEFVETKHSLIVEDKLNLDCSITFNRVIDRLDRLRSRYFKNSDMTNIVKLAYQREIRRATARLPFYAYRWNIIETLKFDSTDFLIIVGETGSGKTTQVPQYLLESGLFNKHGKKIVVTQTRKLATISLAKRISDELLTDDASLVAYKLNTGRNNNQNFDIKKNNLIIMTDKNLLNEYKKDSTLKYYSCIIIDEAHERTLFTDVLICELKKLVLKRKRTDNPLKLIIMSATLNADKFSKYFDDCPVIEVPGRAYPVKIHYEKMTNDYVKQTVDKVKYIIKNKSENPGHVLIFLPSIDDVIKCVKLTRKHLETFKLLESYELFGLYGSMEMEEQLKVFDDYENKTKLIFSTNIAETSITINGIATVIDSGRFKERVYDQDRNIAILKLSMISQSSAIQRKGRAGRTTSGNCYRLYDESDFNDMEFIMKPEIFRIHLGIAVLQIMSCGIENVLEYDLIDKPEKEVLMSSIEKLKSLGLIDPQNKITQKGQMAAEMYLEPSISRIILEGMTVGVSDELVAIVSMMTVSNLLYDRTSSNDDKNQSRLNNLQTNGDFIYLLDLFDQYKQLKKFPEKRDWCSRNCFSLQAFKKAEQTHSELIASVKYSMQKFSIKTSERKLSQEEKVKAINHSICAGLFANLAFYNGKLKNGSSIYKLVELDQEALLHVSSTLATLTFQDFDNKYLLFGDLMRIEEKLFIKNVLPIKLEMLNPFVDIRKYSDIQQNVKETLQLEVDEPILQVFKSKNGQIIEDIEKKTGSLVFVKDNLIETEVSANRKSLATKCIKDYIEEVRQRLEKEMYECKPEGLENAKLIVKAGLRVHTLLFHSEYLRLNLYDLTSNITEPFLWNVFGRFGEIIELKMFKNNAYVIFNRQEDAAAANLNAQDLIEKESKLHVTMHPSITIDGTFNLRNSILKLSWFIRPAIGHATLFFSNNQNLLQIRNALTGLGYQVTEMVQDNGTIKFSISNALARDPLMDEISFKDLISSLGFQNTLENCFFQRQDFNEQMEVSELDTSKAKVISLFGKYGQMIEMDVTPYQITKSGKKIAVATAFIKYEKLESVQNAVRELDNEPNVLGCGRIHLSTNFLHEYKLPMEAFALLKSDIDSLTSILKVNFSSKVFTTELNDKMKQVSVTIKSNSLEKLNKCINIANPVLKPLANVYPYFKYDMIRRRLNKDNYQKKLQDENKIFISKDARFNQISIYGKRATAEAIFKQLIVEVDEFNSKFVEIPIQSFKAINNSFNSLKNEFRGEIRINYKDKKITFTSKDSMAEKFKAKVKEIEEKYIEEKKSKLTKNASIQFLDPCPICGDQIENKFTLVSCKHSFCAECLRHQFHSIGTSFSNISCIQCNKELFIADIKRIANYDSKLIEEKCGFSFNNALLLDLRHKYAYCSMCNNICKVVNGEYFCEFCKKRLCQMCNDDPHRPLTCEQVRERINTRNRTNENLFEQYKKDLTKPCPKCRMPYDIEKSGGCNHMTCPVCKIHFCWHCFWSDESAQPVYDHLTQIHGGCF